MALLCRRVMIFSLSVAVMGCASIHVEHLTEETFVPRRTISQIEWLNQEPVGPTRVGSPYFEPGLLGPSGAAFGLYGYGWYTPYSSNPYILTQGATDQPRIDHVLSGIAIRYHQDSDRLPSQETIAQ